jgi:hypothetical protein
MMITKASFCVLPIFVLVLLTLPSRASAANQAEFDLRRPNGCHPVGTRTIVLRDPRRQPGSAGYDVVSASVFPDGHELKFTPTARF